MVSGLVVDHPYCERKLVRLGDHSTTVYDNPQTDYNEETQPSKRWCSLKNFIFGLNLNHDPLIKAKLLYTSFRLKQSRKVSELPNGVQKTYNYLKKFLKITYTPFVVQIHTKRSIISFSKLL